MENINHLHPTCCLFWVKSSHQKKNQIFYFQSSFMFHNHNMEKQMSNEISVFLTIVVSPVMSKPL